MSTERRSAFSRAVRSINPGRSCGHPNPGTSADCTLLSGHDGAHRNAYPPDATVAHYQLQNALALIVRSYAALAPINNNWPGRHNMEGQSLLCELRDAIATGTGKTAEDVQNEYS